MSKVYNYIQSNALKIQYDCKSYSDYNLYIFTCCILQFSTRRNLNS